MVVVFPSQHLGEECFSNPNGDLGYPTPPLHGALAGFSWLTFQVPSHASIPFTAAGLLRWSGLKPQLVPVVATGTGSPQQPDPMHSALEVPWSLWLSPPVNGTWHHSASPVTSHGRTELWHTRLGLGGAEPPAVTPLIKAFWSFGFNDVLAPPSGLELSRVVQTDFIQVAPNRTMQLTFPSPTEVAVVVTGPGYLGTTDPGTPDAVRAYVQEKTVKTSDADLEWAIPAALANGTALTVSSQTASETIWKGTVKLPAKRGSKPLRILVAEFEQHKVVRVGNLPNHVSYLDAIAI